MTPWTELFYQKSHTCNFEKFIWGTYRWAIKMMFGSFWRKICVVYPHMPILSYFHPHRPCHMPPVNIWGQNVKCHQLIHHIWVLQTRFVRDVLCFKCVTWATWGTPEDIKPRWPRLMPTKDRKPRFNAVLGVKVHFREVKYRFYRTGVFKWFSMPITFLSAPLSMNESGLEVPGTRATLGSEFLKFGKK